MRYASLINQGIQSLHFLGHCLTGYSTSKKCPDCGHENVLLQDRKFMFARLYECRACRLRFRHPLDDQSKLEAFYQSTYTQEDGITTDLPTKTAWEGLIRDGFKEKSVKHHISLIGALFPDRPSSDIRILDYGCSWGYQTWQFCAAGFDCTGFEISQPRAAYGRNELGLRIHSDHHGLSSGYDVFFSSHVIEHVPSPLRLLEEGFDLLRPGGYMIIESPNGSDEFRSIRPDHFHKLWGRVHPFMMSPLFYIQWLAGRPAYFTSWPFDDLGARVDRWDRLQTSKDRLDGPSMLMITRKT